MTEDATNSADKQPVKRIGFMEGEIVTISTAWVTTRSNKLSVLNRHKSLTAR